MVDYEGQKLGELIFHVLIISFGSVGWVIGYIKQDFTICVQAWLVGVVLSIIVRADSDPVCYGQHCEPHRLVSLVSHITDLCRDTALCARLALFQSASSKMARLRP